MQVNDHVKSGHKYNVTRKVDMVTVDAQQITSLLSHT